MVVRLVQSGRRVICDHAQGVRWIAEGYAVPVPEQTAQETGARTTAPVGAHLPDVETR